MVGASSDRAKGRHQYLGHFVTLAHRRRPRAGVRGAGTRGMCGLLRGRGSHEFCPPDAVGPL